MMIQLLFQLVFIEMGLILALVFGTPIRELLIKALDLVKQGRGTIVAKTVAGTVSVVFISSLYSVIKIQKRSMETGSVNPTEEVLLAYHLLEASLMGFSLFLSLVIDRLHYYIKQLKRLKDSLEEIKQLRNGYTKEEHDSEELEEETKKK